MSPDINQKLDDNPNIGGKKKKKSIIIPLLSEQNDLLLRFGVPLLPSFSYFYVLQQMYHILY